MTKIYITGGPGSGKSTIAQTLNIQNYHIYDIDEENNYFSLKESAI